MIYFIEDTVSHTVKVGYSKDPDKRLSSLQTATPNALCLLGTIPGGLEHEAAFHEKFSPHRLQGEWFTGAILGEVRGIIARAASESGQPKLNVIVTGDSNLICENKEMVVTAVSQALNELHASTPIAWVITGGDRLAERAAWVWAERNHVRIHRYYPKWKKHGRFAGFKVGPQLLRSMFDPKLLLTCRSSRPSPSVDTLIRQARRAGIPVVTIDCVVGNLHEPHFPHRLHNTAPS